MFKTFLFFPGPLANIPLRAEVPRSYAPVVKVDYLPGEEVLTEVTGDAGIDPDDEEAMKVFGVIGETPQVGVIGETPQVDFFVAWGWDPGRMG